MYEVTNPKTGKTYTFGGSKRDAAIRLAGKFDVTVKLVRTGQPQRFRCECGRPSCGGCDDAFDARRDAGYYDRDYYAKRRRG